MGLLDKLTAQLPLGKKSETTEYYFALNIGLTEVTAVVWGIYGDKLDILGQASSSYDGTDDLVDQSHQVLDRALGALEIEPTKVLFGVPESWSFDDNLKEPYLKLLRKMLKEFGLGALAYVTTTNALAFFLQKQEGVAPTAILLGVGDYLEATLARSGKVMENRILRRGEHLFDDIEKLLGQFTEVEVLPAKILIYPTKEGEDILKIKDEMMAFPWMQRLSFLHFPKIEVLEGNITTEAVVASGAVEIHPQVDIKRSFTSVVVENSKASQSSSIAPREKEDMGFVKGDIKEHQSERDELEEDQPQPKLKDEEIEEDAQKEAERPIEAYEEEGLEGDSLLAPTPENDFDAPPTPRPQIPGTMTLSRSGAKTASSSLLSLWLKKMEKFIPVSKLVAMIPPIPFGSLGSKLLILPVLVISMAAFYLFLVKASVTVFVEPRVLEQNTEVVADPKETALNEEKKVIPGEVVETTVSGLEKGAATGQKQIGDPAKGKVVLYNLTDGKVSFSQGTVLTSSNNLKFTLDTSVQIASQSSTIGADFVKVTKPGKSDPAGVTASVIGPDGNLPGGSELTLSSYSKSQVVAKVEEALSGGTSKNVTVVTSDDQKKLQAKIIDGLREKAVSELQEKLGGEKKIISEALAVVDGKYSFSKQVNDQASEFSLNATVRFKGTSYSDADLKTIVSKLIKTNAPEGFELNVADMETQADVAKVEKDGRLIFKAKFKAKLLPIFDLAELKNKMKGKSVLEVVEQLKGMESVLGSEIKLIPNLPAPISRLPFLEKNIDITITPK